MWALPVSDCAQGRGDAVWRGLRGDWAAAWLAGRPKSGTRGRDGKQAAAGLHGREVDGPMASRREGNEAGGKRFGPGQNDLLG